MERRALQIVVAIACLVPFYAGGMGVLLGPDFVKGVSPPIPVDLDSHFRYISGIFLGVGLGFATCIADIERKGERFRMLAAFIVLGGLARALSAFQVGLPSTGHVFGLCMELGVVPLLALWQARVQRSQQEG